MVSAARVNPHSWARSRAIRIRIRSPSGTSLSKFVLEFREVTFHGYTYRYSSPYNYKHTIEMRYITIVYYHVGKSLLLYSFQVAN
jgi:hypothetical protein